MGLDIEKIRKLLDMRASPCETIFAPCKFKVLLFVWFDSLHLSQQFLVMLGRVILQRIKCLAQRPWPQGYKLFSCSTQLSMKFQLHIKINTCIPKKVKMFLTLSLSDVVFIMLINVKMPTIVGIFTFLSRINFVLS